MGGEGGGRWSGGRVARQDTELSAIYNLIILLPGHTKVTNMPVGCYEWCVETKQSVYLNEKKRPWVVDSGHGSARHL